MKRVPTSNHVFYSSNVLRLHDAVCFQMTFEQLQGNHSKPSVKAAGNSKLLAYLLISVSGDPGGASASRMPAEGDGKENACDKPAGVGPPGDAARHACPGSELEAAVEELKKKPDAQIDQGGDLHEPGDEEEGHQGQH